MREERFNTLYQTDQQTLDAFRQFLDSPSLQGLVDLAEGFEEDPKWNYWHLDCPVGHIISPPPKSIKRGSKGYSPGEWPRGECEHLGICGGCSMIMDGCCALVRFRDGEYQDEAMMPKLYAMVLECMAQMEVAMENRRR